MIGSTFSDESIAMATGRVRGRMAVVTDDARKITDNGWRSLYAQRMSELSAYLDSNLKRFGVEVKEDG